MFTNKSRTAKSEFSFRLKFYERWPLFTAGISLIYFACNLHFLKEIPPEHQGQLISLFNELNFSLFNEFREQNFSLLGRGKERKFVTHSNPDYSTVVQSLHKESDVTGIKTRTQSDYLHIEKIKLNWVLHVNILIGIEELAF